MKQLSLFRIALLFAVATTVHAQTYTVLYNFGTKSGDPMNPSYSGIIAQSRGGHLFSGASGATFKITTGGSLTVLHSFNGADGSTPTGGLTLATDGQYYGTAEAGGTYGYGTIFKMKQDGTVTTLYSFQGGADGMHPFAPPIESEAGQFYGTTAGPQYGNTGSVYRITKYGDFTLLHTFTGPDGAEPFGPLVQGTDYFFYGTTQRGGTHGFGTIFRISRSGDFKVLFNFDSTNGNGPFAGLIQANDGNYYGITGNGGLNNYGVVFKMTPPGYAVTVLQNMGAGEFALGGLVQATDGNLYGTTASAGSYADGILFRLTLAGDFTVLHSFTGNPGDGANPGSTLMQHTNGILYGMTINGGAFTEGVFYSLDLGLKPFVSFLPVYGRVGTTVQILGQGFTADSTVSFNGVLASFTEVYPTYLRAVVPGGATSGPITVTTPTGTLTSNKIFLVRP